MMTIRLKGIMWEGVGGIDLAQDRGKVAHWCEHGKVPSGYIKYAKFLAWLRTHMRLKKDSVPRVYYGSTKSRFY